MSARNLSNPSAAGGRRHQWQLRRQVFRAVRRGEAVPDRAGAAMAVAVARRAQQQKAWSLSVVVPALVLAALAVAIGGFALTWYLLTVVPTLVAEPYLVRRRRDRALSAEAANLALLEDDD